MHHSDLEPVWQDYTPVLTGGGAMTIGALVVRRGRYLLSLDRKTISVSVYLEFTLGGVAADNILVSFPPGLNPVASGYQCGEGLYVWDSGAGGGPGYWAAYTSTPGVFRVMRMAGSGNWALGAAGIGGIFSNIEVAQ